MGYTWCSCLLGVQSAWHSVSPGVRSHLAFGRPAFGRPAYRRPGVRSPWRSVAAPHFRPSHKVPPIKKCYLLKVLSKETSLISLNFTHTKNIFVITIFYV